MSLSSSQNMAEENANQSSISVLIHPLVVLNVSEHWMRERLLRDSTDVVVYGVLLGKQKGREVEIFNSFELLVDEKKNVDRMFLENRQELAKQVHAGMDILGWYTTGEGITEGDRIFNLQFVENGDWLVLLKLNPLEKRGERLPVRVYESVIGNDSRVDFKQVIYDLANDPMEHIGIDHLARVNGMASSVLGHTDKHDSNEKSQTAEFLMSNFQAVQMLSNRLRLLRAYVDAVARGELPFRADRMREIRALFARLPHPMETEADGPNGIHDKSEESTALVAQATDVCLSTLLGGMSHVMQTLTSWLAKERILLANRAHISRANAFAHASELVFNSNAAANTGQEDMVIS